MNLYLVRHGEAAALGGKVVRDADRPLTVKGEHDIAAMGEALSHMDGDVGVILSSPLRRAVQSAGILASAHAGRVPVTLTDHLAPGFLPGELMAEILSLGAAVSVIAVGHQPDLGRLISHLVGDASLLSVAIPPGTAARISLPHTLARDGSTLHWLLPPEALHRLRPQKEGHPR
jgi:phosphohistidine phosphatase